MAKFGKMNENELRALMAQLTEKEEKIKNFEEKWASKACTAQRIEELEEEVRREQNQNRELQGRLNEENERARGRDEELERLEKERGEIDKLYYELSRELRESETEKSLLRESSEVNIEKLRGMRDELDERNRAAREEYKRLE